MNPYHKIETVFKRDPTTKFKTLLLGEYAQDTFSYLKNNTWVFTEKVDGTNIRIMVSHGHITFGGRSNEAQIPPSLIARLEERFFGMQDTLTLAFPDGACFYGEGYGAKIQKGGENYKSTQDFVLFDIKVGEWWLQRPAIEDIAQQYGIDIVPIIGKGTLLEMVTMTQQGFASAWGNFTAEGVVARPEVELKDRRSQRIITKIKYKDFNLGII